MENQEDASKRIAELVKSGEFTQQVQAMQKSADFKRRMLGVPIEEVIVSLDCIVNEVKIETKPTYHFDMHTPIGVPNPPSGVMYVAELSVKNDQGIRTITYPASVFIQGGDSIRAYVIKGKRSNYPEDDSPPRYHPREFQENEEAFKLEKLVDGKVVLTYEMRPQ